MWSHGSLEHGRFYANRWRFVDDLSANLPGKVTVGRTRGCENRKRVDRLLVRAWLQRVDVGEILRSTSGPLVLHERLAPDEPDLVAAEGPFDRA